MATMVVGIMSENAVGVGITARSDNIMDATTVCIPALPVLRIPSDRRHRAEVGERAPHAVTKAQMRAMQRAGFTGIKPLA